MGHNKKNNAKTITLKSQCKSKYLWGSRLNKEDSDQQRTKTSLITPTFDRRKTNTLINELRKNRIDKKT